MANASANNIHHGTLVATTVDTVTLTNASRAVTVFNRATTGDVYFTVGTTLRPPAAPTAGADDCEIAPAGQKQTVTVNATGGEPIVVKLVSSATPTYTVTAL